MGSIKEVEFVWFRVNYEIEFSLFLFLWLLTQWHDNDDDNNDDDGEYNDGDDDNDVDNDNANDNIHDDINKRITLDFHPGRRLDSNTHSSLFATPSKQTPWQVNNCTCLSMRTDNCLFIF